MKLLAVAGATVALLVLVSTVVALSMNLSRARCEQRNAARTDTSVVLHELLTLIDPDHSSPLWVDTPDRPSVDTLLRQRLGPVDCPAGFPLF